MEVWILKQKHTSWLLKRLKTLYCEPKDFIVLDIDPSWRGRENPYDLPTESIRHFCWEEAITAAIEDIIKEIGEK